ncbi:MAG TPA: insulinase family protein, partial [Phaeodactylibacter sp.]|nr:insulinase family protein [Phaeodactylibacter sp.]
TGFAHLFEHLMFAGSKNVDDYDYYIQKAGGENNAYTTNDSTNFYTVLPAANLELVFWLESDRMVNLNINENSLEVQRKVVLEEFKETCLNQPYGDAWHHLTELAYKVHPYRWPTIGKVPRHIEEATLEDVRNFYHRFYHPANAVLAVAGNIKTQEVKHLAEKWFADIPAGKGIQRMLPQEPPQHKIHQLTQHNHVPADAIFMAFHIPDRLHPDYYVADLMSDILCSGGSSRLYRRLHKEQKVFAQIDAYITGSLDPGLLVIEGRPRQGTSISEATEMIWAELEQIKSEGITQRELQKLKNKVESELLFSEMSVLNKALNLAFFEGIGKAEWINQEVDRYKAISTQDILRFANETLVKENCSELFYLSSIGAASSFDN